MDVLHFRIYIHQEQNVSQYNDFRTHLPLPQEKASKVPLIVNGLTNPFGIRIDTL